MQNGKRRWKVSLAGAAAIGFMAVVALLLYFLTAGNPKGFVQDLSQMVHSRPWIASLLFLFLYAGLTGLPVPGTRFVALGAGMVFGFGRGFLLVYVGALLGATLGYFTARLVLRDRVLAWLNARHPRLLADFQRNDRLYLFSIRLNPLVSFAAVNLLAGATGIGFVPFLLISGSVSILYTFLYVWLGSSLGESLTENQGLPVPILGLLFLLAVLPLLLRRTSKTRSRDLY